MNTPLVSIQILRALAALAVAYGHAGHDLARMAGGAGVPFEGLSGAGVDLFFAISGLVMVISTAPTAADAGAAGVFLRRRLARIVPLYWLTTTLFLATLMLAPGMVNTAAGGLADIARSYLFIPYLRADIGLIQPVYGLGWTLNYEMFFYLLFAAGLWLAGARGAWLVAAGLALWAVTGQMQPPASAPLRFWSDPIVLEFAFGILIGLAHVRGVRMQRGVALLLGAAAIAGFFWLNRGGYLPAGWMRPVVVGLPMALVLAAAVLVSPAVCRGRFARPLAMLGDASYALYLIHPMVIRPLGLVWERLFGAGHGAFVAVALAASAAAALLVFRAFERPVTRKLQAWVRGAADGRR